MMNEITKKLLQTVAGIASKPDGAYNIRQDSGCAGRHSTEHIEILSKEDQPGIDIRVHKSAQGETVYIPALVTHSDVDDLVYNDFYIEDGADVTIIAGCGIHTEGGTDSRHNGIHRFFIGKNARVLYVEKHIGIGEGTGKRIINPQTFIYLEDGGYMKMDSVQIEGVDSTKRYTKAELKKDAKLIIQEKIMTHGTQISETDFHVDLNGDGAGTDLISRAVAKERSLQVFKSVMNGNAKCAGHSECDGILMDQAIVRAIPEINANHLDAALIHEAAIGKIAGEQLVKLMTLGLTEKEAEAKIVDGFLK